MHSMEGQSSLSKLMYRIYPATEGRFTLSMISEFQFNPAMISSSSLAIIFAYGYIPVYYF